MDEDICLLCLDDKIYDKFKYKCKFCNKNIYCEDCLNSKKMNNNLIKFLEKCPLCRKKNWNNNIILENSILFENENYNIIMPETIITININSDQIHINDNNNTNNEDDEDYNIYNDFYNTFKKISKIILDITIIFTVGIIFVNMFYKCELYCLLDRFFIFLAFLSGIIIVGFIYSIISCIKNDNSNE